MTELPTTFGKYYLTEKLAIGGMAEIYLAKIIGPGGFEKPLVIKQIHPKLSGNRHFVDLFVAEAKTLVTLAHGNIVPVYELGVVDDTYFIAMEYIDGPTLYRLTEIMARRDAHMPPALAAWITARILDGLDYAHRKGEGVIHRDLSPRNVMLSRDGEVKLVDFGIAVTLGAPGEGDDARSAPTGSFPYMSPEQVRREPLTIQTDLFSVGVLCWEMLAGRRLFARPDPDATLAAVQSDPIPAPSSVRPEVPAKLDEVVMRALQRDRSARWPTASDMLAQLNKYLYALDETPGPRDLAALVARYCPPETRRLPTHADAIGHDTPGDAPARDAPARDTAVSEAPASPSTVPHERAASEAGPSGPRTAVIPRAGTAHGKPQRQQSFATNVDIRAVLDRATPLAPFAAIDDSAATPDAPASAATGSAGEAPAGSPAGSPVRAHGAARDGSSKAQPAAAPGTESSPAQPTTASRTESSPAQPTTAAPGTESSPVEPADATRAESARRSEPSPDVTLRLSQPPSRSLLVLVGLGGLALAAGAVYVFYTGRDRVLHPRDAAVADAFVIPGTVDAAVDAPEPADAGVDAASVDAGREVRDAGARRGDAPRATADAALDTNPARGTGTLEVGAIPWGEIYIDGKLVGRTPRKLSVAAGHHTVEIVFPAETPPRKQTFAVDLGAGETKPLQADFSN